MCGTCIQCMGKTRNTYTILVGKHEEKRPLRTSTCTMEDNIKINLKELVCENVDWINVAQDWDLWRAFLKKVMTLRTA
jgi:hypothetical protein